MCVTTHWCYRRTHLVRGDFAVSTSEVVLAATSTRRFPQHIILVLYQIPHTLTFPENLCCSRFALVRHGHPVNHRMCLALRRGASRAMTKCNGIIFKNNFQSHPNSLQIIATPHHCTGETWHAEGGICRGKKYS